MRRWSLFLVVVLSFGLMRGLDAGEIREVDRDKDIAIFVEQNTAGVLSRGRMERLAEIARADIPSSVVDLSTFADGESALVGLTERASRLIKGDGTLWLFFSAEAQVSPDGADVLLAGPRAEGATAPSYTLRATDLLSRVTEAVPRRLSVLVLDLVWTGPAAPFPPVASGVRKTALLLASPPGASPATWPSRSMELPLLPQFVVRTAAAGWGDLNQDGRFSPAELVEAARAAYSTIAPGAALPVAAGVDFELAHHAGPGKAPPDWAGMYIKWERARQDAVTLAKPPPPSASDLVVAGYRMVYVPTTETGSAGGFHIGRAEVTLGVWKSVMGSLPAAYGLPQTPPPCKRDDCPVVFVSWTEAAEFANTLSRQQKLQACYRIEEYEVGVPTWSPDASRTTTLKRARGFGTTDCTGYRLPTEAEWSLAARAGGADPAAAAWTSENAGHQIHPTATLAPNAWGIFDMSGNAAEWLHDPLDSGPGVLAGGHAFASADASTSRSRRVDFEVYESSHFTGLRLVKRWRWSLPDPP